MLFVFSKFLQKNYFRKKKFQYTLSCESLRLTFNTCPVRYFTFLEKCTDPKACTILLRGASKDILNEVERNLQDAMNVARNVMMDGRLAPGGGATEMALAQVLYIFILVWPTCQTPVVGGLIVCESVRPRTFRHIARRMMNG